MQVRVLAQLAAAALIVLALFGCAGSNDDGISATGRSDAARWLGADVPAAATDLRFLEQAGFLDDNALIRFDLPADDVDEFLATIDIGELQPGRHAFSWVSEPSWFTTEDLTAFAGASSTNRFPVLQVTADVSNPDTTTLYILAFEV